MGGFDFQTILVIGGTSGIGWAFAEKYLKEGRKVIITGRRQDRLDQFAVEHGGVGPKLAVYKSDITQLAELPAWVEKVTKEHPDIDAVVVNSGIQRAFNFAKPASVDLDVIEAEFTTNYLSYIHLIKAFLPFLMAKKSSAIACMSSGLALIPLSRCLNYCATKAALHHFLMGLRVHLQETSVRVIEIFPPAVQTELHDKEYQPDIENGRNIGMPLADFTNETYDELAKGNDLDEYPIGMAKFWYDKVEPSRQEAFRQLPQKAANVDV